MYEFMCASNLFLFCKNSNKIQTVIKPTKLETKFRFSICSHSNCKISDLSLAYDV